MNVQITEESQAILRLEIINDKVNTFLIIVLFVMTSFSATAMILSLFTIKIKFGTIIFLIILALITYYFLRLFLWNWKGKEIIEITSSEVKQVIDYWLFKEHNILDNQYLEVVLKEEQSEEINDRQNDVLDVDISLNKVPKKIIIQSSEHKSLVIYVSGKLKKETISKIKKRLNNH